MTSITQKFFNCHIYPQKGVPSTPLLVALVAIVAATATLGALACINSYHPPYVKWVSFGMASFTFGLIGAVICHARCSTPSLPKVLGNIDPFRPKVETMEKFSKLEDFKNELLSSAKKMHGNFYDDAEALGQKKEVQEQKLNNEDKDLRAFNLQIFDYVSKKKPGAKTPIDFLWTYKGMSGLLKPVAIGNGKELVLDEGSFYDYDHHKKEFEKVVKEAGTFGFYIKKDGEHLDLYLDGISKWHPLFINDDVYLCEEGRGSKKYSYRLKEGDVVCLGTYEQLFTVGPNGTVFLPADQRNCPNRDLKAEKQSLDFETGCSQKHSKPLFFTSNSQAAEISSKLEPGFSFYSSIVKPTHQDADHKNDVGDLVFVDFSNDKILQQLAEYLQVEFEVMEYTSEEKMIRLVTFAADLMSENVLSYKFLHNYKLGEIVRSGRGVCRHRALLIKALADKLDLHCALVASVVNELSPFLLGNQIIIMEKVGTAAHAWNIMEIDNHYWLVDAMHKTLFRVDQPPGKSTENQKKICSWYGIKGSAIDPNHK